MILGFLGFPINFGSNANAQTMLLGANQHITARGTLHVHRALQKATAMQFSFGRRVGCLNFRKSLLNIILQMVSNTVAGII